MQYPNLTSDAARHMLLVGCAVLLVALFSLYGSLLKSGTVGPKRTDFLPIYTASQLVAHGHGGKLYDLPALGMSERNQVRPLTVRDGVMPYLYPPFAAAVMSPLGLLSYNVAFVLWLLFNLGFLVLAGVFVLRYLAVDRTSSLLVRLAALSFLPVLIALAQGQMSLLLLAGATGAFWALRGGRDAVGGALLTVLAIKPTYLVPVLLVLAIRARWRALAAFGLSLGTAAALAAMMLGASILGGYARVLASATGWQNSIGGFSPRWNQSIDGLTQLLGPPGLSTAAAVLVWVVLLALLARCARRMRTIEVPLAAAIVVGLLASPHVLVHDLALLVLPAAVFWRESGLPGQARSAALICGYLAVLLGLPLATGLFVSPATLMMSALGLCLLFARPTTRHPARPSPHLSFLVSPSSTLITKDHL